VVTTTLSCNDMVPSLYSCCPYIKNINLNSVENKDANFFPFTVVDIQLYETKYQALKKMIESYGGRRNRQFACVVFTMIGPHCSIVRRKGTQEHRSYCYSYVSLNKHAGSLVTQYYNSYGRSPEFIAELAKMTQSDNGINI
jgi:hypothetical protein